MADPQLTREQRRILLNALDSLSLFETQVGRSSLLVNFPRGFTALVQRADIRKVDLNQIVSAADTWGRLSDGTPALLVLLENALELSEGSDAGRILQALYDSIATPSDPPPAPPIPAPSQLPSPQPIAPAPLSPTPTTSPPRQPSTLPPPVVASTISAIARAQRYRDLKDAAAASDWRRVQELAAGMEDYRDVADLLARADSVLGQSPQLLDKIADAYAADEWARVIVLARQIGMIATPELADWVTRAWRELPIESRVFANYSHAINSVAVTPDGQAVLVAPRYGYVELWGLYTGQKLVLFNGEQLKAQNAAKRISSLMNILYPRRRLNTGAQAVARSSWHANVAVITPDGRQVLSSDAAFTRYLTLWDLGDGTGIATFAGPKNGVQNMVMSRNGQLLLCEQAAGNFCLWDLASSQVVHTFTGHHDQVLAIAVSPNDQQALSGAHDKTLKLWDVASAQILLTLTGHTGPVSAVTFTPDGQHALSGSSSEGALRLWDLATGQELRTFPGHGGGVTAVTMTLDGRKIVSGGDDGTVRVWTLPPGLLSAEIL